LANLLSCALLGLGLLGAVLLNSRISHAQSFDLARAFQAGDTNGLSGMLVFSASVDGREGIYVLDLDAARIRRVVTGPGNNSYPSFNPDGTKLSFTSDRDGNKEIYLAEWDGANPQRLTNTKTAADNSSWAFEKNWIVYYAETSKDGKDSNIFAVSPENPIPFQITRFNKRNTTPRFDASMKNIAYSTSRFWPGWDICLWNLRQKKENCILSGAQSYCRPRYSPDGKFLAYSGGVFDDIDVAVLNLESNDKKYVTDLPGREYDATWSPDGKHLAFAAENGRKDLFNVYVLSNLDKKTIRSLITSDYSIRFLDWSATTTFELESKRIREAQAREPGPGRPHGSLPRLPALAPA
jgi:Tol biopolymer transport system component